MKKQIIQITAAALVTLLLLASLVGCIRLIEYPADTTGEEEEIAPDQTEPETLPDSETESSTDEISESEPTDRTEPPTPDVTDEPDTEPPTEVPTESPTEAPTEPPTEEPTEAPTEPETTPPEVGEKIKIYIDQGHNPTGAHNAGAEGNGLKEQDITYTVGVMLAELLHADGRFEVCLSRPTVETVLGSTNNESLAARADGANAWGADYFISIHANSHTTSTAHGIEAFAYSSAGEGYTLGGKIVNALVDSTGLESRGMKTRTDLYVLKHTAMPAVLVELGFISNPTEAALMGSKPELFAQGIYNGIVAYFQP